MPEMFVWSKTINPVELNDEFLQKLREEGVIE